MNITKTAVDKLKAPTSGNQARYYDDNLKGFGVRVTASGVKSFFLETMINGKQRRMTLGRYPSLTIAMAKGEARKLLGKIASGLDPIAEKKAKRSRAITLQQAFDDYMKARKSLKPLTIKDYNRLMLEAFDDWRKKKIVDITKDMIVKRHTLFGKRSQARANLSMRLLRAIFNFAVGEYEDAEGKAFILENPVKRLSHTKAWYRVDRKQTVIKKHELKRWYDAVMNVEYERSSAKADTFRDYLLMILFTGLRRNEAAKLTWDRVDFEAKTLTIEDTKNHQSHTLPLSNFLFALLSRRKVTSKTDYVFPGTGKEGYIIEPRKVMAKVMEQSGVQFTLHDLRRTFITIAESLDIPAYALKKLLNHKNKADVTAGYLVFDVERLRKPMQLITDNLLILMGVKPTAEIIRFNQLNKKFKQDS